MVSTERKCDFCSAGKDVNEESVVVLDRNGFVATEFDTCEPCTFKLVELLEKLRGRPLQAA